ncbi:hypothetical protein YC2023_107113 [Brassica napus]
MHHAEDLLVLKPDPNTEPDNFSGLRKVFELTAGEPWMKELTKFNIYIWKWKANIAYSHGQDCIKLYTDGKDYLNQALKNVKSSDYRSASVHLSAALDAPTTCETGFKETIHKKSPVAKENKALFQKILIPLAFSNMI